MRFLKYEFENKEQFDTLKDLHLTDEDNNLIGVAVVEVGHITIEEAILSEDGEVIKEAVYSDKFAVDILWQSIEPLTELESFEVYPNPRGIHSFAGLDYLYELEYYNKFPELRPVEI